MKRYLLFIHQIEPGLVGPVVGAVEVPGCFEPTDAVVAAASAANFALSVVNEDELEKVDGLAGLLLRQGEHLMTALRTLMSDPSLN